MPTSQYEAPDHRLSDDRKLGWFLEAEQEGQVWLKTQRPSLEWENALQVLSGPDGGSPVAGLSNLGYNKAKRIARELVAGLSDFRHEGEYKTTWDNTLYDAAHTLTNLDRHWYTATRAGVQHRAGVQFAIATGTGYWQQTWDRNFHSPYRGDIKLQALSPADVTFVQLPKDNDLQRAYAVIIREELPINLARAIYGVDNPRFAASLVPDRDAPGWLQKGLQKVQQFLSPALRVAGKPPGSSQSASFPTVDIFHQYTIDASLNDGSTPIVMGARGTNWSYIVPALGDPVPTGIINPATNNYFTAPAGPAEARLFPLRRYTIYSRTALGYDGSSPYWHGMAPLARLRFCDWAWEALGQSSIGDLKTMQDGIIALMRGIEDAFAAQLDPPMTFDDALVSRSWAETVTGRKAGWRGAAPLSQGDPIKPLLDPAFYTVPANLPVWIESQESRMDYLSGVTDLVAIAKAKQVPGADTLEKLLEMAGPIVRDNVRALAEPLWLLGEQRKSMYFQFYTRARMITVTGPNGVRVDQQYVPEQLVPLGVPGETPEQRASRARGYLDNFVYDISESGINEINRLSDKLLYIQLSKLGFPIDWWTLAKICMIPNFGPPPDGTNTVMERWTAQKKIEIDLAAQQAIEMAHAQAEAMLATGGLPGGGGPGDGGGAPGQGAPGDPSSGGNSGGRPPSFSAAPKLVQKDGNTRSTITTS